MVRMDLMKPLPKVYRGLASREGESEEEGKFGDVDRGRESEEGLGTRWYSS